MEADSLLQQGIAALRDEKDAVKGRELLLQALRLNPELDQGWLWLSRTIQDPVKKRQCVERALSINPANSTARAYLEKLTAPVTLGADDEARIAGWLEQADACVKADDIPSAVQHWARVLELVPDHKVALPSAVRHLSRLKYIDDARQLVWTALQRGTRDPSVYLTAIEIARYQKNSDEVERLRADLVLLPDIDDKLVVETIDHFIRAEQKEQALALLDKAVQFHPRSQLVLLKRAELAQELGRQREALEDYERAAQLGASTKVGREADARLLAFAPRLTDRERGSVLLAMREALGIGAFFLIMGWQDAQLNLAQMGATRWGGVGMALVGGYLLITATSSPQQRPLAHWLGGQVPPSAEEDTEGNAFEDVDQDVPEHTQLPIISPSGRYMLGAVGVVLLVLAFMLVFSASLNLIRDPNPEPFRILTWQDVINAGGE